MKTKRWSSTVVTNNQNAHSVAYDTEKKMIWEPFEINLSQIARANFVSFRGIGGFLKEGS